MRKFYTDKEVSFDKPFKKVDKTMKFIVVTVFILMFVMSLLPLIHFVYASFSGKMVYSPNFMYYLFDGRPNSYGSIAIRKTQYAIFFSDIFFGGFKPLILANRDGNYINWIEFSDSLSFLGNKSLGELYSIVRTYNNTIYQVYFLNNTKVADKRIVALEDSVLIEIKPNHDSNLKATLYIHNKSLGCVKIIYGNATINGNNIIVTPESNRIIIKFVPFSSPRQIMVFDPFLLLYPLIALTILLITWWYFYE